jgi:hypothetical protein
VVIAIGALLVGIWVSYIYQQVLLNQYLTEHPDVAAALAADARD